jgi:hypothetical protein
MIVLSHPFPRRRTNHGAGEIPKFSARIPYPTRQSCAQKPSVTRETVSAPKILELPRDNTMPSEQLQLSYRIEETNVSQTAHKSWSGGDSVSTGAGSVSNQANFHQEHFVTKESVPAP